MPVGVLTAARLPVLTLHGILDAIGAEDHAPQRPSARAGAQLGTIGSVVMSLIRTKAHHFSIAHESLVEALGTTVGPTAAGNPLALLLSIARIAEGLFLVEARATRCAESRRARSCKGRPLQQVASCDAGLHRRYGNLHILHSLLLLSQVLGHVEKR